MFKKKYLSRLLPLILIAQIIVGYVFAVGTADIKIGRSDNTNNLDNSGTFLQKAYCAGANYYYNVLPDVVGGQRVSTVMRFITGDTNINTSNFYYNSWFDTNSWTVFSGSPLIVTSSTTNYELLEAGYYYVKMERYTEDVNKVKAGAGNFNFGNFNFTNNFGITGTNLKLHYNLPNNDALNSSTNFGALNQGVRLPSSYSYLVNVKFIPEPCVPDNDAPVGSDRFPRNTITKRAAIDSGVRFRVTEPPYGMDDVALVNYAYTSGTGRGSGVSDPLTTAYTGVSTGTNQRGINTGSITITLTYTGVARNTMDQRGTGTAITKVFSGSDLVFDYLTGPGDVPIRTWNMNYLGAYVSVSGGVLSNMLDFRKETPADIRFDGSDWATPLLNIVNTTSNRSGANRFLNSTNDFNAGDANNNPDAYIGRDMSDLITGNQFAPGSNIKQTINQITGGTNTGFYFKRTDNRAGVAMNESGRVKVEVWTATNTVMSSYQTSFIGSPQKEYTYSGSELHLTAFSGSADYDDYTGYIDLSSGGITLQTGDRVKVTTFVVDYVGNTGVSVRWFDMQDYPPAPTCTPMTIQLENHLALTDDKVTTPPYSLVLSGRCDAYGALSGFLYSGYSSIELTQTVGGSSLTGAFLENGVITGYAHVDTGLDATKTFTFSIIIRNIYNQTGLLTLDINVEPSCADAAGCGPKIMMYTGTSLYEAQNSLTGTWYGNRFVKIKGGDRPVLTGTASTAILYCAGSGGVTSVDITNLDGYDNGDYDNVYTFSGSTLYVSGDAVYGMSGIIYQTGVIYIFRDLTGDITYDTGKYIGGVVESGINWTRDAVVTGTITVTGGYITGENVGLFTLSGVELGGGMHWYTYASDITGFDIMIENRWNSSGTVEPVFYQTGLLRFNNSWIDRQAPIIITGSACLSPHTGTIILTSQETGYGENFSGNLTYLTGDDDLFIITAITTGEDFTSFGDNQLSGTLIYDINAHSGSRAMTMTGDITFVNNRSGYLHYVDKAGNTGSILLETNCVKGTGVLVYAIPGYRDPDNYAFTGYLQVYTLTGSPLVGTYYSSYTGSFGSGGTGVFELPRPLYGQTIGVVLQTSMHLPALGFTGVFMETGINSEDVGTGVVFDFTVWTGRGDQYRTSGWFDYVDLGSPLGWRSLLVPGDVSKDRENVGTGSIINAFDMAVINANLTLDATTDEKRDMDFDRKGGIISSFEQAVIIQNLQREGWDLNLDQFGGLIYTGF